MFKKLEKVKQKTKKFHHATENPGEQGGNGERKWLWLYEIRIGP